MFHVGQRIVCINDDFGPSWMPEFLSVDGQRFRTQLPQKNRVYTVREVCPDWRFIDAVALGVRLMEIHHPACRWRLDGSISELCFWARRFRPLTERKTDTGMAILKKLLQPKHERV